MKIEMCKKCVHVLYPDDNDKYYECWLAWFEGINCVIKKKLFAGIQDYVDFR